MSSVSLVDWGLAGRLATAVAGEGPEWTGPGHAEVRHESARAAKLVRSYTGLRRGGRIPEAELIDRPEWVRTSLASFQAVSGEIERRLAERIEGEGEPSGMSRIPRAIAAGATGIEVGLLTGYLAQRVVGQYDVALLGPVREPRLLYVAPNLAASRERLDADPELFLRWVALHEVTHAIQFSAVGWLRDHLGSIATELIGAATVEISPGEVLGRITSMGAAELARTFASGELIRFLWPEERRARMDSLIAAMTVVEGYAEHVMDAVGARLDPRISELRSALESDRAERGKLDALVAKLFGLEMKLSQYARGRAFCDTVAAEAGIKVLNRVWRSPETLPSAEEIERPSEWIERMGRARERRLIGLLSRS